MASTDKKRTDQRAPIRASGWKQSVAVRWALFALFVLLFYFSLSPHLIPTKYNIQPNTISEIDIKAPYEVVDENATLKAQEEAAARVEQSFTIVVLGNVGLVDQVFNRIEQLNQDDQVTNDNKIDIYRREIPQRYEQFVDDFVQSNLRNDSYNQTLLEEMAVNVKAQAYDIPEETFYKLPRLTSEQLNEMRLVTRDIVKKLMGEQLREAESARTKVAELVNASQLTSRTTREIVQELARFALMPNRFIDKELTDAARVQAKANTPKVVISEGEYLIRANEKVTPEIYQMLTDMGLLKGKQNYLPQLGLLIVCALLLLLIYSMAEWPDWLGRGGRQRMDNAQVLMLLLIYAINMAAMQIIGIIQSDQSWYIGYLAPVALGAMLITLLLDERLAVASSFLFAITGSVIFNTFNDRIFDFQYGFVIAVVSFGAIFSIHKASQRSTILKAGIMASFFGIAAVLALLMLGEKPDSMLFVYALSCVFASGLLTAVLVIGLMPFFEVTFGILSALKLVELSNPNHPLLRKLLTETPGTYHHSVMVGNLSEAAAESVGANGLLCRVGSFYHDIGKTKRPSYFIENQSNIENPHDSMDPKLSKSIIIAHARDGVEMLKAHNIPKPIRDIAEQHHGTTFLKFFYYKALKQAEAEGIEPDFTEDDFRYPGPKAQSKEAAIVGIADCIEAAVRSLRNPTMEHIESMIHKIIRSRLDDNQFNECDLTMKELDKIAETLKETVVGIFHSRIEYPEEVKPKERLG